MALARENKVGVRGKGVGRRENKEESDGISEKRCV